jgi:hypothetical protein
MTRKHKYILLSVFLLSTFAGFSQAPKYSNEFLAIGIGARSLGMSNSTVASCNDVTGGYWNPASLTLIQHNLQLGVMHAEYFAGIAKFDYAAGAAKISDSVSAGLSIIRFAVDDIPNTLELIDNDGNIKYDRIKSFSVADYAFLFSYARISRIPGLRYGANVKIIRRKAGEFASAWGFGFDAAARYEYKKWLFGAVARDVTSTFNAWSFQTSELEEVFAMTGNEIPENSLEITMPKLLLGSAYQFNVYKKIGGLAEVDADLSFDGKRNVLIKGDPVSVDPHVGFEFNYNSIGYFRFGAGNFQQIPGYDGDKEFSFQPNLGLGIRFWRLAIDYALTDIGDQSIALYSNVFSIHYSLDKKK